MQYEDQHEHQTRRDLAPAGEFAVSRKHHPDLLILSLSGDLDVATSALLERELDVARACPATHLVVDLNGLAMIDSTGLGALVTAQARASQDGNRLSFKAEPGVVQRLLGPTERVSLFSSDEPAEIRAGGK